MSRQAIPAVAIRALVTGVALLLAACAGPVAPGNIAPPVAVPAVWQQGTGGVPLDRDALSRWWTCFDDPVLTGLITGALGSSPDVRTALSRVAEYRARRNLERAGLFPALNASVAGGGTRTRDRATGLTVNSESFTASLDASWQVDLFGTQRLALDAASADLAQMQENYRGAQVTLAAAVATAYVGLRSAEAQLAVVQHSLGTREETVQLTQWREQAGTGSALDTQQARTILAQAQAAIPALQLAIVQSRNQLALLCGRGPGALDDPLAAPRGVPAAPANLPAGLPAEILRQRPDVRAAERGLEAALARTSAARRQRLPALTLTGSLGVEAPGLSRLSDPATVVASLLGGLTAPIFDAGRITQTIAIQGELQQQALIAYEATVLRALGEVENALVAVRRDAERQEILGRATAAAGEAATLAGLQYQAGQVDLLVSLDAQRTLLDLQQQSVVSTADRAGACILLYQALGGGWPALLFPSPPVRP